MDTNDKPFLFPGLFLWVYKCFHHCFVLILHMVDGIPKAIIHSTKYHYQVHGFVELSETKVVNV